MRSFVNESCTRIPLFRIFEVGEEFERFSLSNEDVWMRRVCLEENYLQKNFLKASSPWRRIPRKLKDLA